MEFPIDLPQDYGWPTVVLVALGFAIALFVRKWKREDALKANMDLLLQERKAAAQNGNLREWKRKDNQIRSIAKLLKMLVVAIVVSGCKTVEPQHDPVIIGAGQGLMEVRAGDTVPALLPDAVKWYLIDDVRWDEMGFQPL